MLIRYFLLDLRSSEELENSVIAALDSVSRKVLAERLRSVLKVDAELALANCQMPILYLYL